MAYYRAPPEGVLGKTKNAYKTTTMNEKKMKKRRS
jgi:hypothetical protein